MNTLISLKKAVIILILFLFNSSVYSQNSKDKPMTNRAQTNNGTNVLVLKKHTISIGGGVTSGSNYVVTSSIGQIDAGHITTGSFYQFNGGILAASNNDLIFKDGFE